MDVYEVRDKESLFRSLYLSARKSLDDKLEIQRLGHGDNMNRILINNARIELELVESECIRLGYGERDAEGNFRLKEKE